MTQCRLWSAHVGLYIASLMTYVQLVVHYISNFVGDYVLVQSNVPSRDYTVKCIIMIQYFDIKRLGAIQNYVNTNLAYLPPPPLFAFHV